MSETSINIKKDKSFSILFREREQKIVHFHVILQAGIYTN